MKTYTFVSKINRNAVLTITAENFERAERILFDLGLDLEDWNY